MGGIILAFKDYNLRKGILKSPWAGLSNFQYLFKTQDAFIITRNTILYNVAFIIIGTVIAILTAVLLNEVIHKKVQKTYQTLILLPYLISIIVVSYIVYAFLSMETGLLNGVLQRLGYSPVLWYSERKFWPLILTFVHTWKGFGYNSIVYYAVIVGIDANLYEAARVDGASKVQEITNITLPSLRPTIITLTILAIGRIFYSDFGLFYQVPLGSGLLYSTTQTIDTYVYRSLLELNNVSMSSAASVFQAIIDTYVYWALFSLGDYGMSSAASLYQSAVGFVLVVTANALVRKIDRENAMF